jgi:hypothetical protein
MLYNRSILHILPKNNCTERELAALLGILSSSLGRFLFLSLGRKSQRALFPKLLAEDLQSFPLPKQFAQQCDLLAQKTLEAEICTKDGSQEKILFARKAIDEETAKLYGLEDATWHSMRHSLEIQELQFHSSSRDPEGSWEGEEAA